MILVFALAPVIAADNTDAQLIDPVTKMFFNESAPATSCSTPAGSGVCEDTSLCSSGTAYPGYCAGAANIQCCVPYGGCVTPFGSGTCEDKGACSGTAYAGYCPGANNIQCCVSGGGGGALDRDAVVAYAAKWWDSTNHDCSTAYTSCSPWSYWGGESCGLTSQGGDCANFASQSLLAGGHPPLNRGACRGYPCGYEEVGANNLGSCLHTDYGWTSTCGAHLAPPANLKPGDILVFHGSSCTDSEAHATVVTSVTSTDVLITCHSTDRHNYSYKNYASSFGYYQWLHYND
jgi:hypothetical protein